MKYCKKKSFWKSCFASLNLFRKETFLKQKRDGRLLNHKPKEKVYHRIQTTLTRLVGLLALLSWSSI